MIDRRYPDADAETDRTAALSAAVRYLLRGNHPAGRRDGVAQRRCATSRRGWLRVWASA